MARVARKVAHRVTILGNASKIFLGDRQGLFGYRKRFVLNIEKALFEYKSFEASTMCLIPYKCDYHFICISKLYVAGSSIQ